MKYLTVIIISLCILQSCNQSQQSNTKVKQKNTIDKTLDYCDCQIIKRDDGVVVTQYSTVPIASDNKLEFGISISSNGVDYFLSTLIRFKETATKINGDLTIRFENNNMLTFNLVNSALSQIGNSETTVGIFSINESQINDLRNSDLLTVSFILNDNAIYTLECVQNKSVLKQQINCITKSKKSSNKEN